MVKIKMGSKIFFRIFKDNPQRPRFRLRSKMSLIPASSLDKYWSFRDVHIDLKLDVALFRWIFGPHLLYLVNI